ncbi:hypothetical protein [Actinoplanes sp. NPDC051411]|uniref:hypothetical protein n=1 Tax=Actinoplanes sp. NPDC051411 TaxID=3155522 RepID=UPI003444A061
MDRRSMPRGLVARALLAVLLFAVAVVPAWTLGDLAGDRTGWGLLDWLVTCAGNAVAVRLLAPLGSYRPRDAWLGLVPIYGWYVTCVLCWRVALLPYRDWEPRDDELWQARWLTGDLLGYWRADPVAAAGRRPVRSGTGPAGGRRPR